MDSSAPPSPQENSAAAGGESAAVAEGGSPGQTRYRCVACGNLTRFDVVSTRRTKAFHHYSVGGDLAVEEEEVLDERVESVSCRWCGNGGVVETIESAPTTAP